MGRLLLARLLQGLVVVGVVATLTFFLIRLAPGDPFSYEAPNISPALREQWRERAGFNRPPLVQYGHYLRNIAQGDLGFSIASSIPVTTAIANALPQTLVLTTVALGLAPRRGASGSAPPRRPFGAARFDRVASTILGGIYAIPDFALALLILFLLAEWRPIFPAAGIVDPAMHAYLSPMGKLLDALRPSRPPSPDPGVGGHRRDRTLSTGGPSGCAVSRFHPDGPSEGSRRLSLR